ncbi:hypothetical protein E2986_13125 [Frieseomelitta varia]|uniref:Uncharacterized protein n=1 Tax=Frieseomelitta varia TaxID=561572 RepID=A0A833SDP8_9HYME|nr:hypothetical protein E2986_13125 [Frieseomelitta varia]
MNKFTWLRCATERQTPSRDKGDQTSNISFELNTSRTWFLLITNPTELSRQRVWNFYNLTKLLRSLENFRQDKLQVLLHKLLNTQKPNSTVQRYTSFHLCVTTREVRFMFALIPYFCLWVSVVWHSCMLCGYCWWMVIAMSAVSPFFHQLRDVRSSLKGPNSRLCQTKRIINLLLRNNYPATSYRRVRKESDELFYTVWSLVMVRNQLPPQVSTDGNGLLNLKKTTLLMDTLNKVDAAIWVNDTIGLMLDCYIDLCRV